MLCAAGKITTWLDILHWPHPQWGGVNEVSPVTYLSPAWLYISLFQRDIYKLCIRSEHAGSILRENTIRFKTVHDQSHVGLDRHRPRFTVAHAVQHYVAGISHSHDEPKIQCFVAGTRRNPPDNTSPNRKEQRWSTNKYSVLERKESYFLEEHPPTDQSKYP